MSQSTPNQTNPDSHQQQMEQERQELRERTSQIKHKISIFSGKGGVGKSTVAANLAFALHEAGKTVGLLDIDIHGPSIPKLLGLEGHSIQGSDEHAIEPIEIFPGLKVMSIGFLLPSRDDAIIWRGPMKYNVIKQFIKDVLWGSLDYLIIDSPPGTGDEPLAVAQLLEDADGAIVVTTPQQVAISDVRKCVNFCHKVNLPVLGVIENMSGFVCPHCQEHVDIFKSGGGKQMAQEMNVPFLGAIPIDPNIVTAGDNGQFIKNTAQPQTYNAFNNAIQTILKL
ncbi:MAG: Mrp/NBP35 family ATP-binding protein [Sedimentisphaerales bacterium]|nr:Mrp/NBP35 family ATP-binding protein [Sedimentisphaerales bacterium]